MQTQALHTDHVWDRKATVTETSAQLRWLMSWVGVGVGGVLTALMCTHCTLIIWSEVGIGSACGANNVHVHLQTQALQAEYMVGVAFGVGC